jgi:hypothetical protein
MPAASFRSQTRRFAPNHRVRNRLVACGRFLAVEPRVNLGEPGDVVVLVDAPLQLVQPFRRDGAGTVANLAEPQVEDAPPAICEGGEERAECGVVGADGTPQHERSDPLSPLWRCGRLLDAVVDGDVRRERAVARRERVVVGLCPGAEAVLAERSR